MGKVDNEATARGDDPQNNPVTDDDQVSKPLQGVPGLALVKSGTVDLSKVAPVDVANPGDTINYAFTVTNTGNVPLTGVTVSDPLLPALNCQAVNLQPGDAVTLSCTNHVYALTQADIERIVVKEAGGVPVGCTTILEGVAGWTAKGARATARPSRLRATTSTAARLAQIPLCGNVKSKLKTPSAPVHVAPTSSPMLLSLGRANDSVTACSVGNRSPRAMMAVPGGPADGVSASDGPLGRRRRRNARNSRSARATIPTMRRMRSLDVDPGLVRTRHVMKV